jgi:hypothetical protein
LDGDGAQNYMICFERSKSCTILLTNSDNGQLALPEWEGYTREYIEASRTN